MFRALMAAAAACLAAACGTLEPTPLAHSLASSSALAEAALRGFERRDLEALRALALSEQEFRDLVWPELPASRPERNLPFSYVWGDLKQKSDSSLSESLARHGGRAYTLLRVEYGGETTRYGAFLVHRETRLVVRLPDGSEGRLRLYGSTLERSGVYKVFSYVADN